jgi:hypothetical protein
VLKFRLGAVAGAGLGEPHGLEGPRAIKTFGKLFRVQKSVTVRRALDDRDGGNSGTEPPPSAMASTAKPISLRSWSN